MLEPELFSAVARSATPLWQFGTHYQLIWLIMLTTCFYLVLNAASNRISSNFRSRPSHKRCPRLWFVSLNWHNGASPAARLIDWLNTALKATTTSASCSGIFLLPRQHFFRGKLLLMPTRHGTNNSIIQWLYHFRRVQQLVYFGHTETLWYTATVITSFWLGV